MKNLCKGGCEMAQEPCKMPDTGDLFPAMVFDTVKGEKVILPMDFGKTWNVLLFYRGHW